MFVLEVVGEQGVLLHEEDVEEVTVRRRDPGFLRGSEVSIRKRHAPLLMQTGACDLRWRSGGRTHTLGVPPGIIEVYEEHIWLVLTRTGSGPVSPDPLTLT